MEVLCAFSLLVLALLAYDRLVRRFFALPRPYDEIHFVTTEDGWRLALQRYRPCGEEERNFPVILSHGLGANRYNLDFGERSLARYLSMHGYDVWLFDKRGCGMSEQRGFFSRVRYGWNFDDIARFDVPAVIAAVREKTGAAQVHWVGHSEGGLVAYVHLQRPAARREVASLVAIGSPGSFRFQNDLRPLVRFGRWLTPLVALQGTLAPFLIPWLWLRFLPPGYLTIFPPNVEFRVLCEALVNLVTNVPRGLFGQYVTWITSGTWRSEDGSSDYEAGLGKIDVPVFLIAGSADRIVPPASVELVYERIASTRKRFDIVGKGYGEAEAYGHGDLLVGRNVVAEIFPRIEAWLRAHDSLDSLS